MECIKNLESSAFLLLVIQSCLTLCNHCSPPGSSVHGILQARRLEWLAMPSSRGSSRTREWTWVSCTAGRFFTVWDTKEAHVYDMYEMELRLKIQYTAHMHRHIHAHTFSARVCSWDIRFKKTSSSLSAFGFTVKKDVKLLSHVRLFATLWTVAHQAPLSMAFSRQEYWSG